MSRIAARFARVEPRRRVRDLVLGLLSDLPRKNCWSIAEWAGGATPDGMQHLLGRARWDADDVRDDVREYVLEHLHDEGAAGLPACVIEIAVIWCTITSGQSAPTASPTDTASSPSTTAPAPISATRPSLAALVVVAVTW